MVACLTCPVAAWAQAEFPARVDAFARTDSMTSEAQTAQPADGDRDAADALLIGRISAGERTALGELYDRHSRPLYATALRILSDTAEAQDVVHDAFLTLWQKSADFRRERGTVFAWAVTLVRNRAIDRLRSRRRRSELLAEAVPGDLGIPEQPDSGQEKAVKDDRALAVRTAVSSLPQDQRNALELAFFAGLTQQEISERLGEPLGTVKARIRRGLHRLRDLLANRL
jgi:RNA polymerase sigma-70 factor (ECF subfamily)